MLDRLSLPDLPVLRGNRVILRPGRDSDIDDRLAHPIDLEEEDAYGSSWRREWDGRRYHAREHLEGQAVPQPPHYQWAVEHGAHRVQLEVLAGNVRAIRCYEACGFRHEGIRREGELYPDGWKDFLLMGILQPEHAARRPLFHDRVS